MNKPTNQSNVVPFSFQSHEIRTVVQGDELWFVAKDVCDILGLDHITNALVKIPEKHLTVIQLQSGGQNREMKVIDEAGLYRLVLRSDKPEAEPFMEWVTTEVLPTIRKTGGAYLTAQKAEEILLNPDAIIQLATQIKELHSTVARQQAKIASDLPKTIFADAVSASHTSILVGDLAKLLKQNGIEIGANRLFEYLRVEGYLIRRKGTDWNSPTQRAMELGLFEVKERTINEPNGSIRITRTTTVTGKGQLYFVNRLIAVPGKMAA